MVLGIRKYCAINHYYQAVMSWKSGIYGHNKFPKHLRSDLTFHKTYSYVSPKHTSSSEEADETVVFSAILFRSTSSIWSAVKHTICLEVLFKLSASDKRHKNIKEWHKIVITHVVTRFHAIYRIPSPDHKTATASYLECHNLCLLVVC